MSVYELLKPAIVCFKSKGNAEIFYPEFCSVIKDSTFQGLDKHCNHLLKFELANQVLAFLSEAKIIENNVEFKLVQATFTEKDMHIINYLSGCVIGTFYRRNRYRMGASEYQKDCLFILSCFRCVEGTESDLSAHKLIDIKDAGGLTRVNKDQSLIHI